MFKATVVCVVLLWTSVARAQFGGPLPVLDVTEIQKTLEILQAQVRQIQMLAQNLRSAGQSLFHDNSGQLDELTQLIDQGDGLSYMASNLQQRFNALGSVGQSPAQDVATIRDTSKGVLNSLAEQQRGYVNEAAELQALAMRNSAAPGALSALQTANEIALHAGNAQLEARQLEAATANAQVIAAMANYNLQMRKTVNEMHFWG